jgi:hypothetical protein
LFKRFHTSKADFNDVKKITYIKTKIDKKDDFEPKKSHKIGIGVNKQKNENVKILNFRPALFDKFERRDNLLSESTLELLNVSISEVNQNVKLENFDIIKMESFNKRFDFYEPISWRFYSGFNRTFQNKELNPLVEIGFGLTKGNEVISFYGLTQVATYPLQTSINLQALLGFSFWFDKTHVNFDYKKSFYNQNGQSDTEVQLSMLYCLNTSFNFKLIKEFEYDKNIINLEYKF